MNARFPNEDPFAPWNRADYYANGDWDVYCPWEDEVHRDDPAAPWNNACDPGPFEWLVRDWNRDNPHAAITLGDELGADPHDSGIATFRCPFCAARNDGPESGCAHRIVAASQGEWEDWEFDEEPLLYAAHELPPLLDLAPAGKRDLWQDVALDEAERPDLTRLYPEGPGAQGSRLALYTLAAERTGGRAITATFDSGSMAGGGWTECRVFAPEPTQFHEATDRLLQRLAEIRSATASK